MDKWLFKSSLQCIGNHKPTFKVAVQVTKNMKGYTWQQSFRSHQQLKKKKLGGSGFQLYDIELAMYSCIKRQRTMIGRCFWQMTFFRKAKVSAAQEGCKGSTPRHFNFSIQMIYLSQSQKKAIKEDCLLKKKWKMNLTRSWNEWGGGSQSVRFNFYSEMFILAVG